MHRYLWTRLHNHHRQKRGDPSTLRAVSPGVGALQTAPPCHFRGATAPPIFWKLFPSFPSVEGEETGAASASLKFLEVHHRTHFCKKACENTKHSKSAPPREMIRIVNNWKQGDLQKVLKGMARWRPLIMMMEWHTKIKSWQDIRSFSMLLYL